MSLGQYFTKNLELKKKVYDFMTIDFNHNDNSCLEPSIGRGDLVDYVSRNLEQSSIEFTMYEIDDTIELLDSINREKVIYQDFLKAEIDAKFYTIIGNPPYVRTKTGNLYIDFIEKCVGLLKDKGQLIFIVPSDFTKLTCASKLLNRMMEIGSFTHIYHPNNEHLFENATIDVIVFRYVLGADKGTVLYNDVLMNVINNNGMLSFRNLDDTSSMLIKDYFDVYVGMVSGKEEAYKNPEYGNIDILNGEDKIDRYIYINNLEEDKILLDQLLPYKSELLARGIRKFTEKNWYEWGAPRNIGVMNDNYGRECIYVYNLTRREKVAFLGKVMHFGGNLLMLLPRSDELDLNSILNYLNSDSFKREYTFSNRFKIGQRQLSLSGVALATPGLCPKCGTSNTGTLS